MYFCKNLFLNDLDNHNSNEKTGIAIKYAGITGTVFMTQKIQLVNATKVKDCLGLALGSS